MATEVHCLTCFEALDAELNKRKPLSLEEIQSSWVSYVAAAGQQEQKQQHDAPSDPALRRVAAADAGTGSGSPASTSSGSSSSLQTGASTPATSISSLPLSSIVSSSGPPSTPLFVTWNTIESDDDEADEDDEDDEDNVSLRGCIGTFEPTPLSIGLPEYALISALQDTRFSPVRRRELPSLQVAVTLLTDFEEVADPRDWVVGVHGVRLSFRDRRYGSTYLPDVAAEQGWTRDEALFSLARKAGWVGGQSRWRELDLRVTRYQGKKKTLSYARFRKWRDWVEQQQ